jgi:hypothetical protein
MCHGKVCPAILFFDLVESFPRNPFHAYNSVNLEITDDPQIRVECISKEGRLRDPRLARLNPSTTPLPCRRRLLRTALGPDRIKAGLEPPRCSRRWRWLKTEAERIYRDPEKSEFSGRTRLLAVSAAGRFCGEARGETARRSGR